MAIVWKIAPFLLAPILSSPSFGYVRQVTADPSHVPLIRTDNTDIQFLLNASVVPGLPDASGKCISAICPGSDPRAAVRAALATWNAVTTANIRFLPLKSTTLGVDASDNRMVIAVGASAAELSAVGSALAVTVVVFSNEGAALPRGAILDSDIILNPAFFFSTDGSTANDLESVMTHELGHSLSANHTGLIGASMFQFNTGQRFLTTDDLAFVNAAYPLASGGPALGMIAGAIVAPGGGPVAFALLTAFDTAAGVTIGGVTNPDGTYAMQVPPGNYQMYAEPLNGVLGINIYLGSEYPGLAAGTNFQTTSYNGSVNVAANSTTTANITVTPGASRLTTPFVAVTPVNGNPGTLFAGGPATVPSGQSVDLVLAGAGFDATLTDSNFAIYGKGIVLRPGSVRVDKNTILSNGLNVLRVTLDVAALTTPALASFVVVSGSNTLSFSGALVIVPPTPTFVSQGVISAASFLGSPNGDGAVTPGGIYSIYDIPNTPDLGPAAFVQNGTYDVYGNIAAYLGGVSVTFDGVPAPMFLSYAGQLNFQAPFEVAGKSSTRVVVNYLGSPSAAVTVPVLPVQPAFFTVAGTGFVKAYNLPDYTLNTAQTPAARGSYVEVYGTGVGKVSYTIPTGPGAPAFPAGFTGNYIYSVGGSPAASALFGGWTPGFVGLAQWDLQIPSGIAAGAVSIVVTDSTGASSQPGATIFVK